MAWTMVRPLACLEDLNAWKDCHIVAFAREI